MNRTKLLLRVTSASAALFGFALLTSAAFAQGASTTGTIEGRALNVTNGEYLNNARVIVEGTRLETVTDPYGHYRLSGVPVGPHNVRVSYTGLASRVLPVSVQAGGISTQNFNLSSSATTDVKEGDVVTLDSFVVASHRETDQSAIAINEQRMASNIKSVVSTDAFGDVAEGNIGDFAKFLPGVTIDYVSPDARNISIRGVAPNFTSITVDGNRMASASSSSASRTFELEQVSINNVSRIEITKSRTPDLPADALGGSVNMISKSAFERSTPQFNYKTYLSVNGDEHSFAKTLGPSREPSRKIKPGFDFTYVRPVTKDFGFTLSVLDSNIFYPQHRSAPGWAPDSTSGGGATPETVYMRKYQMQDGPKNNTRQSIGLTTDWRFAQNDVLTFTGQWNYYDAPFFNRNINFDVANSNSLVPVAFSPLFTTGQPGKGVVNFGTSFRRKYGTTYQLALKHVHRGPVWMLESGLSFSHATNHYHDYQEGHFENIGFKMIGTPTVSYSDNDRYGYLRPGVITVTQGTTPVDPYNLDNYYIATASQNPADSLDVYKTARVNARREFALSFPFAVKVGAQIQNQIRDIRKDSPGGWNFVGPDGKTNTADDHASLYDLVDTGYENASSFGFPGIQWPSPYKLWDLYVAHPNYFALSNVTNPYVNTAKNSQYLTETISAAYVMSDVRLLDNRLRLVGGVRFERTADEAAGVLNDPTAVYQKDSKGNVVLGSDGKPSKVSTDPLQLAMLQYTIRGAHVKKTYSGYYPSLDASFTIRPNLIARGAIARSIGRPNLSNIIPNTSISDPTTTSTPSVSVVNTGLEPSQTNSYDLSLEYYFEPVGVMSVGLFRKDFTNFIGSVTEPATLELLNAFGVPDAESYVGWDFKTKFNAGDATVTGVELNYSQSLSFKNLPEWTRGFSVFANYTKQHLEGSTVADFNNFISTSGSWGLGYAHRKFNARTNFNYRGRQRNGSQSFAAGAYDYFKPRVYLDANFEYRFQRGLAVFINARNLTNVAQDDQKYGPTSPSYARTVRREEFGTQYTMGFKGTF